MSDMRKISNINGYIEGNSKWPDFDKKICEEGNVVFTIPKSENIYDAPIFFNPMMNLNRDLSILFTKTYSEKINRKLRIFEPLAGIGIRAMRMLKEIPESIEEIVISDYNTITNSVSNYNKGKLNFTNNLHIFNRETRSLTLDLAENKYKYDYIDLDPFGSPSPYIDFMWPVLNSKALISVTATDMTALCGVYPMACFRKYGGYPINNQHNHETAIRILLGMVVRSAGRHEKGITPIFSISVDHYAKIFFKIENGRGRANKSMEQIGFSFTCDNCHEIYYEKMDGEIPKCCGELQKAGPLWIGKLFDKDWCEIGLKSLEPMKLPSEKRIAKQLLEGVNEEDLKGFFQISKLCKKLKISQPSFTDLFSKIDEEGFKVIRSQFKDQVIRTNISGRKLVKILKELAEK